MSKQEEVKIAEQGQEETTPDFSVIEAAAVKLRQEPVDAPEIEEVKDAGSQTQEQEQVERPEEGDDTKGASAPDTAASDTEAKGQVEEDKAAPEEEKSTPAPIPENIRRLGARMQWTEEEIRERWLSNPDSFLWVKEGLDRISAKESQRVQERTEVLTPPEVVTPPLVQERTKTDDDIFELGDADDGAVDIESRINQRADRLVTQKMAKEREAIAAERKAYEAHKANAYLAEMDAFLSSYTGTAEEPDADYSRIYGHGKSAIMDANDPHLGARKRLLQAAGQISHLANQQGRPIAVREAFERSFEDIHRQLITDKIREEIASEQTLRASQVLQSSEKVAHREVKETPEKRRLSNIEKAAAKARKS